MTWERMRRIANAWLPPLESFIRGLIGASPSNTRGRSLVPELGTPGSVRGAQ